jgi:hypothetical protein
MINFKQSIPSGLSSKGLLEPLLIASLVLMFYAADSNWNGPYIVSCLSISYWAIFSSIKLQKSQSLSNKIEINANLLFLVFYYLVFLFPYQLVALGLLDVRISKYQVVYTFPEFTNQAAILCTLGLIAYKWGHMSVSKSKLSGLKKTIQSSYLSNIRASDFEQVIFLGLVSLITAYLFFGWRAAGEGRYTNTISGGQLAEAAYFVITMLSMLAVALHFSYFEGHSRTGLRYVNLILSGAWAVRILLAGDRNSFLLIAITALIGYYTYVRKVNWVIVGTLAVLAFTYYGLAESFRSSGLANLSDVFLGGSGNTSESQETSFNITTISVRAGLAVVPDSITYGFGFYKLVGIMGVIPFSRGLFFQGTDAVTSTSQILTDAMLFSGATWDVGTNVISDSYIDLGIFGVLGILYLVGRVSAGIAELAKFNSSSVWFRTLYIVSAPLFAELPRYSADFPVRTLLWIWFIFWVVSKSSPGRRTNIIEKQDVASVVWK